MNATPLLEIIKKVQREIPEVQVEANLPAAPNRWSSAVRYWFSEFQEDWRSEPLAGFDSLFKEPLG